MIVATQRGGLHAVAHVLRVVNRSAALFAAAILMAVTGAVLYEVVARYVFNSPTEWSLELSCYGLVWSAFLGAAYTLDTNQHVRVEILTERLPSTLRITAEYLVNAAGLVFSALASWKGFNHVRVSFINEHTSNTPLAVPMYLAELAVPIGMLLLALAFLRRLLAPRDALRGAA